MILLTILSFKKPFQAVEKWFTSFKKTMLVFVQLGVKFYNKIHFSSFISRLLIIGNKLFGRKTRNFFKIMKHTRYETYHVNNADKLSARTVTGDYVNIEHSASQKNFKGLLVFSSFWIQLLKGAFVAALKIEILFYNVAAKFETKRFCCLIDSEIRYSARFINDWMLFKKKFIFKTTSSYAWSLLSFYI